MSPTLVEKIGKDLLKEMTLCSCGESPSKGVEVQLPIWLVLVATKTVVVANDNVVAGGVFLD